MTAFPHISVWRIQDAPEEYKRFCPAGWLRQDGDSSNISAVWLAFVPPDSGWVGFLEGREYGACCEIFEHQLESGGYIAVGGHYGWCQHDNSGGDLPVDNSRVIRAWRYGDERADLPVANTDDADWVAHVHRDLVGADIAWLKDGSSFGCSGVDVHPQPDGSELRIGCHS